MLKKLTKLIPKCLRRKEETTYFDPWHCAYFDPWLRDKRIRGGGMVAKHSHYSEPLIASGCGGSSRDWGHAPITTKLEALGRIVNYFTLPIEAKHAALLLAIVYVESGFNPDAAARSTSATGLGQFIDKTGKAYGLTDENRWDLSAQLKALFAHFEDCYRRAVVKIAQPTKPGGFYMTDGLFDEVAPWIYAYWHDGPSLKYGGYDIAVKRVMPVYREFLKGLK